MSKVITSPVARFPGTVTLADPLTLPLFAAWEDCLLAARKDAGGITSHHIVFLPGIFKIVEKWDIGGGFPEYPTIDTIPPKPYVARTELLAWLINEISAIWNEEETVPNE